MLQQQIAVNVSWKHCSKARYAEVYIKLPLLKEIRCLEWQLGAFEMALWVKTLGNRKLVQAVSDHLAHVLTHTMCT